MKKKGETLLLDLVARIRTGHFSDRSTTLAYAMLMASIPLLFVFVQITSLIFTRPAMVLLPTLEILPDEVHNVFVQVMQILHKTSSAAGVSLGLLTAVWLGSTGTYSLIASVNRTLGFQLKGNYFLRRALAVIYTVVLMAVLVFALFFYVFYDRILFFISDILQMEAILKPVIRYTDSFMIRLIPPVLFFTLLMLFYKSAPLTAKGRLRWRDAALGALIAAISMTAVTLLYAFVTENISQRSIYFGSLAGLLGLLVWLKLVSTLFLFGAAFIASYRKVFLCK